MKLNEPAITRAQDIEGWTYMAVGVNSGVQFGPTGRAILDFVNQYYDRTEDLYVTSAYREREADGGTWSHHNGQTYGGSPTAAVDFAAPMTESGRRAMQRFARWLYDHFGDLTVEMLHSTPFDDDNGFLIRDQVRYGLGYPEHTDHVHYATSFDLLQAMLERAKHWWGIPDPTPGQNPGSVTDCFGWDASNHDWERGPMDLSAAKNDGVSFFTHKALEGTNYWYRDAHYKEALNRARSAGIPVLGAYHVLHGIDGAPGSGSPELQAEQFYNLVNSETPFWRDVPWIWQCDAEKFSYMQRQPNLDEIHRFMDKLHSLAGGHGYYSVYAPKWLYGDTLTGIRYDLWASNYDFSGSARPYRQQWADVSQAIQEGRTPGFKAYSGKEPLILQFSSDATIGTQSICDINKFRGTLQELLALAGGQTGTPLPGGTMSVFDEVVGQGPEEFAQHAVRTAIGWTWFHAFHANYKSDTTHAKLDALATKVDGLKLELTEEQRAAIVADLQAALTEVVKDAVKQALREGTE
jgi:GH25 family lysozyme M1 (1,4-beta-N-acetylmuramidase)